MSTNPTPTAKPTPAELMNNLRHIADDAAIVMRGLSPTNQQWHEMVRDTCLQSAATIRELSAKVEALEAKEAATRESIALIEELHATPGAMQVHIKQSPAQSEYIAQCFAAMVAKSPNYTELTFRTRTADGPQITVLVQKCDGKTPHQLRAEADAKCAELSEQLQNARNLGLEWCNDANGHIALCGDQLNAALSRTPDARKGGAA